MITGKTKSGFKFEIDEETRDDMELLEAIAEMEGDNMMGLPKVMAMLLGEDQKKRLYDHCRTEKGRVSSKAVMTEIQNIFDVIKEGESDTKN